MRAVGIRAKDTRALGQRIDEVLGTGFSPTLCVLFASVSTDVPSVVREFENRPFALFGASSGGEILTSAGGPVVSSSSIAGLLIDVPAGHFAVTLLEGKGKTSKQLGVEAGEWARSRFASPAVLLMSSGLGADGEGLIHGILDAAGEKTPIYGAFAADDMRFQETYAFTNYRSVTEGVVICAIDRDRIEVGGLASHGWKGIGDAKVITRSEANRVYTIDGRPALDLYREYIGIQGTGDLPMALEFPLQIERESDRSVLRAVVGIQEDGSLVFNGNVSQDAKVYLSSPPGPSIIDNTIGELTRFHDEMREAEVGVLFHCAVRYYAFGEEVEREILAATELWAVPLVGVFSYGEIGQINGMKCDFHAATYSLFLMRDRMTASGMTASRPNAGANALSHRSEQVKREMDEIDSILEGIPARGQTSRNEIGALHRRFHSIRSHLNDYMGKVDRLTRQSFTKSALLTKASQELQKKIHRIEILNDDLKETNELIQKERVKSDRLLKNVLPNEIALRMKLGEETIAERLKNVTVLFADIVGFTELSSRTSPEKLVDILNLIFSSFDSLAEKHGMEKIKTIGDCYMVASGVPAPVENPAVRAADFALEMMDSMESINKSMNLQETLAIRAGLHTGDVVAGIIGKKKFSYDLWGDTVNIASRMESHGSPGKIQCSSAVYESLRGLFRFEPRGLREIKGKEPMETFFLMGRR